MRTRALLITLFFFALPPHAANAEEIRDSIPKRQRECLTLLYDAFTRLESSEWESLAKGVEITLGYEIENSDLKAVSKLYQPSYRAILSLLDMVDDRELGFYASIWTRRRGPGTAHFRPS